MEKRPVSKLAPGDFVHRLVLMPEDAPTEDMKDSIFNPRSVTLQEACRFPEAREVYLKPVVQEFTENLRACMARIRAHQDSLRIPDFNSPERSFSFSEREEDFSALPSVEEVKAVSLDIFDTCLVRTLKSPHDVFLLLGDFVEGITGLKAGDFASLRIETERELRAEGLKAGTAEDTSFACIYDKLAQRLDWEADIRDLVSSREITLEKFFLRPVEPVRNYVHSLRSAGVPILYTSEMYLPGKILRELLDNANFPIHEVSVYSSGDYGLSKGTGNLYRKVLEQTKHENLIHIGDNSTSDGQAPKSLGLGTAIIRTQKKVYPDLFSNVLHTVASHRDSIKRESFWESFGFRVAGPVHFAFATHLYRECQLAGIRHLHFLSRDGWFPRKVFRDIQEKWGTVVKEHYTYASREFLGIGSMKDISTEEWNFILKPSPLLRTGDIFERLGIPGTVYERLLPEFNLPPSSEIICHHWGFRNPETRDCLYAAICEALPAFLDYRDGLSRNLAQYLEHQNMFDDGTAFVDVGWNGSSASCFAKLTPDGKSVPRGLYFALLGERKERMSGFFTEGGLQVDLLKGSIALMEFLFGSPESTIRDVQMDSGIPVPVFRKPWSPFELEAWRGMELGIARFTEDCLEVLAKPTDGDGIAFVEETLRKWLFDPDREDLDNFGALSHVEGWGTDNRIRILPVPESITSDGMLREALCYCPWKPGLIKSM